MIITLMVSKKVPSRNKLIIRQLDTHTTIHVVCMLKAALVTLLSSFGLAQPALIHKEVWRAGEKTTLTKQFLSVFPILQTSFPSLRTCHIPSAISCLFSLYRNEKVKWASFRTSVTFHWGWRVIFYHYRQLYYNKFPARRDSVHISSTE